MLEPPSTATTGLAAAVAGLQASAAELVAPPLVLEGWASAAALDYEAVAARIAVGILRVRAALDEAATALP